LLHNDFIGLGLYLAYFLVFGTPLVLCKSKFNVPFEIIRKLYHLLITLSIFPLVFFFDTWYMAVTAAFLLVIIAYPLLVWVENSAFYKRIAVERECGEFKKSLLFVQGSISLMILIFWGLLGAEWKYVAVAAVLAWGFGDAAAALVGKKFGRHQIMHSRIKGTKTFEGTQAMFVTAGLAIFFTFIFLGGQPWHVSLIVALVVAPISAVVELFSNGGSDTLTVPISTGLAVLSTMSIFSYLVHIL